MKSDETLLYLEDVMLLVDAIDIFYRDGLNAMKKYLNDNMG